MNDYYFEGDPAVYSTRRHLERVLQGRPPRRWPWVAAALAGGAAAFAFWRLRSRRTTGPQADADELPAPRPSVSPTRGLGHVR